MTCALVCPLGAPAVAAAAAATFESEAGRGSGGRCEALLGDLATVGAEPLVTAAVVDTAVTAVALAALLLLLLLLLLPLATPTAPVPLEEMVTDALATTAGLSDEGTVAAAEALLGAGV